MPQQDCPSPSVHVCVPTNQVFFPVLSVEFSTTGPLLLLLISFYYCCSVSVTQRSSYYRPCSPNMPMLSPRWPRLQRQRALCPACQHRWPVGFMWHNQHHCPVHQPATGRRRDGKLHFAAILSFCFMGKDTSQLLAGAGP